MRERQSTSSSTNTPLAAVILAAGKGTRMDSDLPKVVHDVAGRPMLRWVVDAVREVGASPIVIVVGHRHELVRELFEDEDDIRFALQEEQLGTAHAVDCARENLEGFEGDVLVVCGDGPLIQKETLLTLIGTHRSAQAAMTLATAIVDDPTGYGRIARNREKQFRAIVEEKNATEEEKSLHEINPSLYCFDRDAMFDTLDRIEPDSVSGEYYLTDAPALLKDSGQRIEIVAAMPPEDVLSINTPQQLDEVSTILQARMEALA